MRRIGDHAVVVGAGVAGLLAARVLVDAYARVTVIERDRLTEADGHRRGVPQGRHAHVVVPGGTRVLAALFPGVLDELTAGGVPLMRDFGEFRFTLGGHRLGLEGPTPDQFVCQASRPYLERHVRARVRALPEVEILDGCDIVELLANPARDRVTGVRIRRTAAATSAETLDADLVVDATGRGSRTPAWLGELGYDEAPQEQLNVDVAYASRRLRLPPGALGDAKWVSVGAVPDRPTGFVMFAQEDDQWILTLTGYGDRHPPTDPAGFLAFVEAFAPPDVVAAVRAAEPLGDVVGYRFPAGLRRRYERLCRFPAGLLVFGDGICSTNPAYALGMSVAALQAEALRGALAGGGKNLARRFFRTVAKPVGVAWQLTTGADLALPQVKGPRPLPVRVVNAYLRRVQAVVEHDPVVALQLLRVIALLDPPARIFAPSIVLRLLGRRLRRGGGAKSDQPKSSAVTS